MRIGCEGGGEAKEGNCGHVLKVDGEEGNDEETKEDSREEGEEVKEF